MSSQPVSPLAPKKQPKLGAIPGVRLTSAATGMKYKGRDDLLLAVLDPGTAVAGVFTKSSTASASVDWCRTHSKAGSARALLVNAGNANAFTGRAGETVVREIAKAAAGPLKAAPREVMLASTGVIGEPMAGLPIIDAIEPMINRLGADHWLEGAAAIMTTDTYPKLSTATAKLGRAAVTVNGIAKGSGMIAPDMATMLAFIFTDAPVRASVLRGLLRDAAEMSFNAVSVDGDTSTSDMVLLFATGQGAPKEKPVTSLKDRRLTGFRTALEAVCLDLAHQIVRDGEGARKFVSIEVTGARSKRAARVIGKSIANSPLVKTAIAGADANWGRIVMAVGKSGEAADRDRLGIWIGGVRVTHLGARDPAYDERVLSRHMKGADIKIKVDVGVGRGRDQVWTCDLTEDYIRINADYRS